MSRDRSEWQTIDSTHGVTFHDGDLMPLAEAGFVVKVPPRGRFRVTIAVNKYSGDRADDIEDEDGDHIAVLLNRSPAHRCAELPGAAWTPLVPYDVVVSSESDRDDVSYCLDLGDARAPKALIVAMARDAPSTQTQLATALGNAAIAQYGRRPPAPPGEGEHPSPPPCPEWMPGCHEKPRAPERPESDSFNPKRRLGILRGEVKVLSFSGTGVDTSVGGALAFTGATSSLDSFVPVADDRRPRTVDIAFAHGGRALLGYESHDNFMFEGFYGLGFLVRVWHVGLMVRGVGGMDVLDGGGKQTIAGITTDVPGVFKLPFGFAVGFDARLRGWLSPGFGLELGGGFLRRVPDENAANWVSREVLLDGHVLVAFSEDVVMSIGVEYADYQWATGVRGTLGFGF